MGPETFFVASLLVAAYNGQPVAQTAAYSALDARADHAAASGPPVRSPLNQGEGRASRGFDRTSCASGMAVTVCPTSPPAPAVQARNRRAITKAKGGHPGASTGPRAQAGWP